MVTSSEDHLIAQIKCGSERPDLDYKEQIDLCADRKREKAELTKDIIAMANFGGGLIIGGVRDVGGRFEMVGMGQDQLKQFDSTRLNDFVKNYSDPPVNTLTRVVATEGMNFGIVIVPGFGEQPHIVTNDYPGILIKGDLLMRSASNNSERAGPHDLRGLLDRAVVRRQGTMGAMLRSVLDVARPVILDESQSGPNLPVPFQREKHLERYGGFCITSLKHAGVRQAVRAMDLRDAVQKSAVLGKRGGRLFPSHWLENATETRLPIGIAYELELAAEWTENRLQFAYFGSDGRVFCAQSLPEPRMDVKEPEAWIGFMSTFTNVYMAILFARRYYPAIGVQGPARLTVSVESRVPRRLVMDWQRHDPWYGRFMSSMDIPVAVEGQISCDEPLAQLDTTAARMMREFCWFFYLDLSDSEVSRLLDSVKSELSIPQELRV